MQAEARIGKELVTLSTFRRPQDEGLIWNSVRFRFVSSGIALPVKRLGVLKACRHRSLRWLHNHKLISTEGAC